MIKLQLHVPSFINLSQHNSFYVWGMYRRKRKGGKKKRKETDKKIKVRNSDIFNSQPKSGISKIE